MVRMFILYGRDALWEVVELGKFETLQSVMVAIERYLANGYRHFEIEVVEK